MIGGFRGGVRLLCRNCSGLHVLALVCASVAGAAVLLPLAAKGPYEVDIGMLWRFRYVSTLNVLPTALYVLPVVLAGIAASMLKRWRSGAELVYMLLAASGLLITGAGAIEGLGHIAAMGFTCGQLAGSVEVTAGAAIGTGAALGFGAYGTLFLAPFFLPTHVGEREKPPRSQREHSRRGRRQPR